MHMCVDAEIADISEYPRVKVYHYAEGSSGGVNYADFVETVYEDIHEAAATQSQARSWDGKAPILLYNGGKSKGGKPHSIAEVRKAQAKNGQVIAEMVALLSPFFGPILIANHGKYNKTYNTKWRISYATHLFEEEPAFKEHSTMIFIDYGGGGPSPSVFTRSVR